MHHREKLRSAIKWVFMVGMLCGGIMFGLILHFWETSPTVPDVISGRVIPQFDKLHGRYVYLTKMQDCSLFILLLLGVICVFSCGVIDFRLKKLTAQSKAGAPS